MQKFANASGRQKVCRCTGGVKWKKPAARGARARVLALVPEEYGRHTGRCYARRSVAEAGGGVVRDHGIRETCSSGERQARTQPAAPLEVQQPDAQAEVLRSGRNMRTGVHGVKRQPFFAR